MGNTCKKNLATSENAADVAAQSTTVTGHVNPIVSYTETQYADLERMAFMDALFKGKPMFDRNLLVQIVKLTKTCARYTKYEHDKDLLFMCSICSSNDIVISIDGKKTVLTCLNCRCTMILKSCSLYKKITGNHLETTYCKKCCKYLCHSCTDSHRYYCS